jgi:hypothetical protein
MNATRLIATGVLTLSLSGCGFLLTKGPPPGHQQLDSFSCTDDNAGPILDIVWGSLNVLGALVIASDPDAYSDPGLSTASGIAWGVVSAFSAASGFKKTRDCRQALAQLAARSGQRQPAAGAAPTGTPEVQAVVLTPADDTLAVGQRVQLVARAHTSSGAEIENRAFSWSSSNDAIASVSAAGLVTAHAPGSVVIAANTGNVVGTARILVRESR